MESNENDSDKLLPNWCTFNCGGKDINGTANCVASDGVFSCLCDLRKRPKFNFILHYDLLLRIKAENMHIIRYLFPGEKMKKWDEFAKNLNSDQQNIWSKFKLQSGKKYLERFEKCIDLVSTKHGIGSKDTGYELHEDLTNFDKVVISLIKEISNYESQKELNEKKKLEKNSTLMGIESDVLRYKNGVYSSASTDTSDSIVSPQPISETDLTDGDFRLHTPNRLVSSAEKRKLSEEKKKRKRLRQDNDGVFKGIENMVQSFSQEMVARRAESRSNDERKMMKLEAKMKLKLLKEQVKIEKLQEAKARSDAARAKDELRLYMLQQGYSESKFDL